MKGALLCLLFVCGASLCWALDACGNYTADWTSLDSRPNPAWYDQSKFGIFVHWGIYSVPSWATPNEFEVLRNPYAEWYWYQIHNSSTATYEFHSETYGADYPYESFAPQFRAELWNPDEWAALFKNSGAKYVVLTSKHHEGFTLWPSEQSWNWNSVDIGPQRDIVGELSASVRNYGLEMGLYYSLYEWYNPIFLNQPENYVRDIMLPQMQDLINTYKPSVLWGDGCLSYPSSFWDTPNFLKWLYNESPVCEKVVINDRFGNDTLWKHGGFFVSELGWPDPDTFNGHKWEECKGMAWSFGYNRMENSSHYWTPSMLIQRLVWVVSHGGNYLLDVGPTADGRIPVVMQNNLLAMGQWLSVNGESIYETTPWRVTNETTGTTVPFLVFYTTAPTRGAVYALSYRWPGPVLTLRLPKATPQTEITYLGWDSTPLKYTTDGGFININLPEINPDDLPTRYVYVLKLTHVL